MFNKIIIWCGMFGCALLASGCVQSMTQSQSTPQYENPQAEASYFTDDKPRAYQIYKQAAQKGDPGAQYQVAQMLLFNDGIPADYAQGVQWLKKAAAQGHVEASRDLGTYLLNADFGCPRDPGQGVSFLEQAARSGDTLSMMTLGYLYYTGHGSSRNPEAAAYWYKQAADHGEDIPKEWTKAEVLAGSGPLPPFDPKLEYQQRVKRAQTALKSLGYYKSAIDGIPGSGTRSAVQQFQRDQQIAVTGIVDAALLRHLYRRIVFGPVNRLM